MSKVLEINIGVDKTLHLDQYDYELLKGKIISEHFEGMRKGLVDEKLVNLDKETAAALLGKNHKIIEAIKTVEKSYFDMSATVNNYASIALELESVNQVNNDLITIIKNTHTILGSVRDEVAQFDRMPELLAELDKFVISSAAIQAGVKEIETPEMNNEARGLSEL